MKTRRESSLSGSALITAMMTITVLALVAAGLIALVADRHRATFQSASWNESILAAEAGADLAVLQLRATLPTHALWSDSENALTSPNADWTPNWGVPIDQDGNIYGSFAPATGTDTGAGGVVTARWFRPTEPMLQHGGEGGTHLYSDVTIDAPASLKTSAGTQWYRIRSVGMADLPMRRVGTDKFDNALRQLSLNWNRRGGAAAAPFASRLIEVVVKPVTAFSAAMIAAQDVSVPGSGGVVDSFDSRDAAKSTGGIYDVSKRQTHGDVATNGTVFGASGDIYGDVATNGGSVAPAGNLHGGIQNDIVQELPPVLVPTWSPSPSTPVTCVASETITAGSVGSPTRAKLAQLSGNLTISPGAGVGSTYAEIWVPGQMTGTITVMPGVVAKFYLEGSLSMKASDIDNQNNRAANVQIYGVNPAIGVTRTIDIAPPGTIMCTIYAPGHDLTAHSGPELVGSFIARTISVTGSGGIHYDEALADNADLMSGFKVVNWLEDVR